MLDPNELKHIRALCREFDEYMARSRAEAERDRIVRKTHVLPPEPEPPPPPAPGAPWRDDAVFVDAVGDFGAMLMRQERERGQRELDNVRAEMAKEVARLQGQVDVLLALTREPKTKGGELVDVTPRIATWRN